MKRTVMLSLISLAMLTLSVSGGTIDLLTLGDDSEADVLGTMLINWLNASHSVFNIKLYGAVDISGGGSTDSTSAIQAAIDAAEAVGGRVVIPNGRYAISSQLTVTEPIIVEGVGRGQKVETGASSGIVVTADCNGIYVSAGAVLRDFYVDAEGFQSEDKCGIYVHVSNPAFRVTMKDVRIVNQGGDGLLLYETNLGQYDTVIARRNGGSGIKLKGNATIPNCNVNTFVNCLGYDNDDHGINLVSHAYENFFLGGEASSNNGSAHGYYCDTYGNQFLGVYAEGNGGNDFVLGSNAKANLVITAGFASITDNSGTNYNWTLTRGGNDWYELSHLRLTGGISADSNIKSSSYVQGTHFRAADGTRPGSYRIYEGSGEEANYVALTTKALASNMNVTLPCLQTYTPTNVTEDRAFDADSTSTAELADVLGQLIVDLQAAGILQ